MGCSCWSSRPDHGCLWQFKYRLDGTKKLLSVGPCPGITLAEARSARDAARALVAKGNDPSAAKRCDLSTVDKAAEAILRFDASTGHKSLARFHIEQATTFKRKLDTELSEVTGKPLSKATISSTLRAVKVFVHWLAGQPGYESKIGYSDAEYFNQNAKDARVAHAERDPPFPTPEQCRHAFAMMPYGSDIERCDKALLAFLMMTDARDGAIASLRLKRIDLVEGCVCRDARDVKTTGAKTFTTWFLPIDPTYQGCFEGWVRYLREDRLFGGEDAMFPKPQMGLSNDSFAVLGLSRDCYGNAGRVRDVIKGAFVRAGFPAFAPHSFRKTLTVRADRHYPTREGFKAFSQNIAHDSVVTTVGSYLPLSRERQAELIRGKGR